MPPSSNTLHKAGMTQSQWLRLQNVLLESQFAPSNPFLGPAPPPDDFSFDASTVTDPDLEAHGWRCYVSGTLTPMTRAGDVTPWTTYSVANTYLSSLIDNKLLIQTPGSTAMSIYKPVTSGLFTFQAFGMPFIWDSTGQAATIAVNTEDISDPLKIQYVTGYRQGNYGAASVNAGVNTIYLNAAYTQSQPIETYLNYVDVAGNWTSRMSQPLAYRSIYESSAVRVIGLVPAMVGMSIQYPRGGFIEFMRRVPLNTYAGFYP